MRLEARTKTVKKRVKRKEAKDLMISLFKGFSHIREGGMEDNN